MLGLKTTLASVAATLLLMSAVPAAVEALPPPGNGPSSVPGLVISPGSSFGTLNGRPVSVDCYKELPKGVVLTQMPKHTKKTNGAFYQTCANFQIKTEPYATLLKSIGCPEASYMQGRKRCYVVDELSDMYALNNAAGYVELKKAKPEFRKKIMRKLVMAHQFAMRLGWYLTWNYNSVYINVDGRVAIDSRSYRTDIPFSIPAGPAENEFSMDVKKTFHNNYKEKFVSWFISTYAASPEEAAELEKILNDPLIPLPTV
ncbi:hypothetical protein SYNPS1DRAFT_30153 [Syncephalis pseudoplumigaleata]|uniref:Uncharacterized protein n=1 Tax=Syncephalis pseudoplumigaleata TaxID=1712513 RepID=A0A4P9YW58_9FUNG|nr:hypothetical protein SYNPS1DRAFT_30153 [Syncephalis pseudoplumigaleata]|eukprot:RKP24078.1 hypothetical protein SYNPS1DRAFT_30153 [Syncephalis pseudoplumigaleata]